MATGSISSQNYKLISFSKSYTITYNIGVDNLVDVPYGYTVLAPVLWDTGSGDVAVIAVKQNALTLSKMKSAGQSSTHTCTGKVLCVKSNLLQ